MSFGKRADATSARGARPTQASRTRAATPVAPRAEATPADRGSLKSNIKLLLFLLVMAALVGAHFPDLMRDWRLASTYAYDANVRVEKGSCRSIPLVLSFCDVDLRWPGAGGVERKVSAWQIYSLSWMSGKQLVPVRSRIEPDAVTVEVAIEKLTNRIATILFLTLGVAALLLAGARRTWTESNGVPSAAPA